MAFDTRQDSYVRFRAVVAERTSPVIAWVGSGLSAPAGLPGWIDLRERLTAVAERKIEQLDPPSAARAKNKLAAAASDRTNWLAFELLRTVIGATTFQETIRDALNVPSGGAIPEAYERLWNLGVKGIINLNLDRLATRALTRVKPGIAPAEFTGRQVSNWIRALSIPGEFIVNLHGQVDDAASWILTKSELEKLRGEAGYQTFIRSCLLGHTILFAGIGVQDLAVGGHLESLRQDGLVSGPHFWLTDRRDLETDEWAEQLGVCLIRYTSRGDDHSEVDEFFDDLRAFVPEDDVAPPVTRPLAVSEELPCADDLMNQSADEMRRCLNNHAAKILEDGDESAYDKYAEFCREYDEAIYRAWYVDSRGTGDLLDYKLEEEAGRGSFGTVYRGRDAEGSEVAVKVLREDIRRNTESLQSFRRGVRSMRILSGAKLDGVVRYLDASEIPAMVVMEWIDGPTLRDVVQTKKLGSWDAILNVSCQLAKIIRQAHSLPQRVLHRDLRPANVMLRDYWMDPDEPKVVVLDFDLSYHIGAGEKTIDLRGATTSGYLAPEQIHRIKGVSTRNAAVDSFGLGMTIYYLVSGSDPFPAEHRHEGWAKKVRIACESIGNASWISLPRRVARVITHATADNQSSRWDLSQIGGELGRLEALVSVTTSGADADMVAEELLVRADTSGEVDWSDDKASAKVVLGSGVVLEVSGNLGTNDLRLDLHWSSVGEHSRKDLIKWIPAALQEVEATLRSGGWTMRRSSGGNQELSLVATAPCSRILIDIAAAGECIAKIARKLEFR